MASKPVDVEQAQARLKELVDQANRGEEVVLTEAGKPVAKIIPIQRQVSKRTFGSARGLIHMHADFDEPIEDFEDYS
jgi:prevent-host-death family protein